MKRLLILVAFLGLTVHFCDVQGSAKISQEELDNQLMSEVDSVPINFVRVRDLLGAGANVNAVDNHGTTALIRAASQGNREVVELLLQAGADVNAVNNYGGTALIDAAESRRNQKIVELLLRAEAYVNAVDNNGMTALMLAAYNGNREIVELLLQAGANVNVVSNYRETALMLAAYNGNREVVELLLQAGADVNVVNNNGKTAIDLAENQEIRDSLMRCKDALTIIPIAEPSIINIFDEEPKLEDYIAEVEIPAGTEGGAVLGILEQDGKKLDQQITMFEQDLANYWHYKVQEAYKLFLVNNLVPMRALFTQEIYAKMVLWPEIMSFFNSCDGFIYVLRRLQQGASEQERERLQAMINVAERRESVRKQQLQQEALKVAID